MTRPFRFGVVAPLLTDVPSWLDRARRIEDAGFSTLLMPDFPLLQPAPAPVLATAAAVTGLRVGTWVYASPFRPAWLTAWEAHSLTRVTDGRFELGIGLGRPGIEDELREKGVTADPPADRPASVRETVERLRALDGEDRHTPVAMAVRGARSRAVAAEVADVVTVAQLPTDSRADVGRVAAGIRAVRDVELALHVSVVGDHVAAFMGPPDTDVEAARAADSLSVLPVDSAAAVEELHRRRDELGFSYVVVGADAVETVAPVVAELAGR